MVVRRDVFLSLSGFDESLPAMEDWEFAIRLAGAGEIAFVDAPLVHQRFSPNSLTRRPRKAAPGARADPREDAAALRRPPGSSRLAALRPRRPQPPRRRSRRRAAALARARAVRPAAPRTRARTLAMSLYVAGLGLAARLRGGSGKIIED